MRAEPVFGEEAAPSTLADPGWANTMPPGFDGQSALAPSRMGDTAPAQDAPFSAPRSLQASETTTDASPGCQNDRPPIAGTG